MTHFIEQYLAHSKRMLYVTDVNALPQFAQMCAGVVGFSCITISISGVEVGGCISTALTFCFVYYTICEVERICNQI
jgi:capsule polysaccharide modification protein KpsS